MVVTLTPCGSAGDPIEGKETATPIKAPPVAIILDQDLVETVASTQDGVVKKNSFVRQTLFAVSCSISEGTVVLQPYHVTTEIKSPTAGTFSFMRRLGPSDSSLSHSLLSVVDRKSVTPASFAKPSETYEPPPKRIKRDLSATDMSDIDDAACSFAEALALSLDSMEAKAF